jgi:hypothetical protein
MRNAFKAGMGLASCAYLAAGAAGAPAAAQVISENTVKAFMDYAWSLTPHKFTKPDGKTIEVDKKKREEVVVPLDVAREVIRVGRISAHAQICELNDDQVANYRSLMKREEQKGTWTPQQMIYINQLHLTTVMLLTGKVRLVDKGGDKEVVIEESKANNQTCTDEQRKKVQGVIASYVQSGPALANAGSSTAPTQTGSTPTPVKK